MRMCQKDKVQILRQNGQRPIDKQILSLLHTVIDDSPPVTDFNHGAAAGYLMGGAIESNLHFFCASFPATVVAMTFLSFYTIFRSLATSHRNPSHFLMKLIRFHVPFYLTIEGNFAIMGQNLSGR